MPLPSPPRVAIYARYSSDLQNPSSVDDQVALCRKLIADQLFGADPAQALVFSDAAMSGAAMERPGLIRLLRTAKAGRINVVVAEGLDRLSRSLKDIATFYEVLGYHGGVIWTAHEGRVTELHIGLKGTMNALFLRDLKARVRRGQAARVAAGFAPSSKAYGYRVVRGVVDDKGRNVNGVRAVHEEQAAIIRRVFEEYAEGRKLSAIVARLNAEDTPSPAGKIWKMEGLVGRGGQGGILRNEAYIGNLIYNRMRTIRDPVSGKRRFAANPEDAWTRNHVPELRIVDDDLWNRVQARLSRPSVKKPEVEPAPRILKTHNQHALTGWVKCGCCGGPKSLANASRYTCSNNRYARKCQNSRGTKEPVLMAATFEALQVRIANGPNFREVLIERFIAETRHREALEERLVEIEARIAHLMEAVERGINKEYTIRRALKLQDEAKQVRMEIQDDVSPALPDEPTIRTLLGRAVGGTELSGDVIRMRRMFGLLLSEIVLTPIVGESRGETMEIFLREEGWPDFWRLITECAEGPKRS